MAFQLKHGKFAFSDLNQAKKCIFADIQHRYSSILIVFRGAGFVYNDWLAQYEDTEFYVTKNIKLWTRVVWSNGRMKVWSGIVGSSVRVWVRAVVRSDCKDISHATESFEAKDYLN